MNMHLPGICCRDLYCLLRISSPVSFIGIVIRIIKYIEENLNLVFDNNTIVIIHHIIKNSPSALYFGLFSEGLLSQKVRDSGYLKDDAEHEIRENFISRLLNDLRGKDFFLSEDIKELKIIVGMHWKFKEKKESKFNLELKYK